MCFITVATNNRRFYWVVISVKVSGDGFWQLSDTHYWFKWRAERCKQRIMR